MARSKKPNKLEPSDRVLNFVKANIGLLLVAGLFFVVHLPGITTPPLDEHAWRQTDTAAVARNFQQESPNIFLPRIDMRANYSGITGMEFPLYNYLVAGVNVALGFTHWHGRILSLVFATAGLVFFYLLLKRRYNIGLANVGVAAMALSPLYFLFAKNIQPDMLMLALALGALYFTQFYIDSKKDSWAIYVAVAMLSVAMLVKIPIVFVSIPMVYMVGWHRIKELLNPKFIAYCVLVLVVPNALWYWWSAHLSSSYGLGQYFYGDISLGGSIQLALQKGFWRTIIDYLLPMRFPGALLYVFAGLGAVVALVKKQYLGLVWFGAFVVFIGGFAIKSFYHNYYSLPLVLPLALIIAMGVYWLYQKIREENPLIASCIVIVAAVMAALVLINRGHNLYATQVPTSYLKLEAVMDSVSNRNELVASNGTGTPVSLYFASRKGWSLSSANLENPATRDSVKAAGAKYILVDEAPADAPELVKTLEAQGLTALYRDNSFVIYKL